MTGEPLLVERAAEGVATLTLNRPEKRNALSIELREALAEALTSTAGDEQARCTVLTGAGSVFCAGMDVTQFGGDEKHRGRLLAANEACFAALLDHPVPLLAAVNGPALGGGFALAAFCDVRVAAASAAFGFPEVRRGIPASLGAALAALPVPVVSAVRGPAAGIGCSLALAADFCVASETAYFLQAFVNIGLVPDGGASWMLPRLIGRARAAEMMMLGERVPAARALDWGMIHKVVADDVLDTEAMALAERLAAGPTVALGLIRQGLHYGFTCDYSAAMDREAESQRRARGTKDSMEGGMAFLEKRKPVFRGE